MQLIGEIYKKAVLSLPKGERRLFEMPYHDGSIRIENDFFGWKLYYQILGRKSEDVIACRSEEEARYIRVFMDTLVREMYIPDSDEVIKRILPDLEKVQKKTKDVMQAYLDGLIKRQWREKLKLMVYNELTAVPE